MVLAVVWYIPITLGGVGGTGSGVVHTYNSRRGGWYWLWYIPITLGGVGGTGCGVVHTYNSRRGGWYWLWCGTYL